jgi:IS30 family transposase
MGNRRRVVVVVAVCAVGMGACSNDQPKAFAACSVILVGLPDGHTADVVAAALADKMTDLPVDLRRSLTWDQGKEMAAHIDFSVASGIPVFFCDPRSPWQRGTNENTNGLLRQYFPKRNYDFRLATQADLDAVADELNGRPRQTLGWRSPSQALDHALR